MRHRLVGTKAKLDGSLYTVHILVRGMNRQVWLTENPMPRYQSFLVQRIATVMAHLGPDLTREALGIWYLLFGFHGHWGDHDGVMAVRAVGHLQFPPNANSLASVRTTPMSCTQGCNASGSQPT